MPVVIPVAKQPGPRPGLADLQNQPSNASDGKCPHCYSSSALVYLLSQANVQFTKQVLSQSRFTLLSPSNTLISHKHHAQYNAQNAGCTSIEQKIIANTDSMFLQPAFVRINVRADRPLRSGVQGFLALFKFCDVDFTLG